MFMNGQTYLKDVATLELDAEKCNGCGMCVIVCPHNVFAIKNKKSVIIDKDACMECGACENNCAPKALSVRSGVGCAAGILKGVLKGTEPECSCGTEKAIQKTEEKPSCGCGSSKNSCC